MADPTSPADTRSQTQLEHHYRVERELADRLRNASKADRRHLYSEVYDELFRRVPDHPQLSRKVSAADSARAVALQQKFLGRFIRGENITFLEIGPGDCALSIEISKSVARVYAVDVSSSITKKRAFPPNFQLVISDGTNIPVPEGTVDVAYSNQLMEHLHPDDAREQLQNVYKALAIGGVYVCITPNRLSGPHDVSEGFDEVATGFHLKEYTIGELAGIFKQVGFRSIRPYVAIKDLHFSLPLSFAVAIEALFGIIPRRLAGWITHSRLGDAVLGIRLVGTRR